MAHHRWLLLLALVSACDGTPDAGRDASVAIDAAAAPDAGEIEDGGANGGEDGGGATDGGPTDGGPIDGGAADGGDAGPPELTFGYPVFTQAEIDAWSTGSAEYARLAGSWAGNVSRSHSSWGPEISSAERDVFRDESVYLKVQAVLWAADENPARRAKVIAMLEELEEVASFQHDAVEQYRLVAGWACTNVAQAAAIVGYRSAGLLRFLMDVCYPILDWPQGGNWHASFADSRLAIAAYAGDPDLWADARAYFHLRIAQSIYHSTYDGDAVNPLLDDEGVPRVGATKSHWGASFGAGQINDDFTPVDPARFVDGTNAERTRDLGHVSMGLGGWMHGARTLLAQGDMLEPHARDRLLAAYAHHGHRVLTYITTGAIPDPQPARGDGGGALNQGWFGARVLFGDDTPADVLALCAHPDVRSFAAAGANHLVAEAFAE